MNFQCDGSSHCEGAIKATVTVGFADEEPETFIIKNPPICVKENQASVRADNKIFRFWAEDYETGSPPEITFEHYACGQEAFYQADPTLPYNGAYLIVDGELQNGVTYFYWQYSDENGGANRYLDIVDSIPPGASGNFKNCTFDACEIIILDKNGSQLYKKKGESPCKVEVACDDNCPPGHLKCSSDKYPGYCCLPCQPTANRIRALGDKLQ